MGRGERAPPAPLHESSDAPAILSEPTMSTRAVTDANELVFLHYTQDELDRNYNQRAWCPESAAYLARYPRESEAVRRSASYRTLSYGASGDEKLDVFPASQPDAPAVIFIHGGAWRNFTKDDFSFVAPAFVTEGFSVIVLNFSKLPQLRLPDVVDQLRRAVTWIHRNAAGL